MEIRASQMANHVSVVGQSLKNACKVAVPGPLVRSEDGDAGLLLVVFGTPADKSPFRSVTTDLGRTEIVVALDSADAGGQYYWIGLHERWAHRGKRRLQFVDCGIRVYSGTRNEQASQFLRLEWVAPQKKEDGGWVYMGAHAGHPHWHVDQSALVGPEYWHALNLLTAPVQEDVPIEAFSPDLVATTPSEAPGQQHFSWLKHVHLPAQADWMRVRWNGSKLPAPHQSEPLDLESLNWWWEGALHYVAAEITRHGGQKPEG
jgi:hypothetical protein